jgi:hypothetical protein
MSLDRLNSNADHKISPDESISQKNYAMAFWFLRTINDYASNGPEDSPLKAAAINYCKSFGKVLVDPETNCRPITYYESSWITIDTDVGVLLKNLKEIQQAKENLAANLEIHASIQLVIQALSIAIEKLLIDLEQTIPNARHGFSPDDSTYVVNFIDANGPDKTAGLRRSLINISSEIVNALRNPNRPTDALDDNFIKFIPLDADQYYFSNEVARFANQLDELRRSIPATLARFFSIITLII